MKLTELLIQWQTLAPAEHYQLMVDRVGLPNLPTAGAIKPQACLEELTVLAVLAAIDRRGWAYSIGGGGDRGHSVAIYPPGQCKPAASPSRAEALLLAYLTCLVPG